MSHHKNSTSVPPPTFAELITKIVVTPDAKNNLLDDWKRNHGVHPELVLVTKKVMKQYPSQRQLNRAKQYQRRTH
jgi:hypothetical protein